ncbi:uncharacterized [Tachysurus ichikawai]
MAVAMWKRGHKSRHQQGGTDGWMSDRAIAVAVWLQYLLSPLTKCQGEDFDTEVYKRTRGHRDSLGEK